MYRQVISRAVLALLRLDCLVVHVHVVLHSAHILVTQQFLQAERIIAQHQVADREGVPEDVRTDALVRDPGSLANARKQQRHAIDGQRHAGLGEKQVILSGTAPFRQLLFTRAVTLQVVEQMA